MRATGENHQRFGKLACGVTEKVDSVFPASTEVRLDAERLRDEEPVEPTFNTILAVPPFEAKEDNSIHKISWSELYEQLDPLLREEEKRSKAVCRAVEEGIDEILLVAIKELNYC